MNTKNFFSISTLLWLALALALAGSLRHVAHTFTSIDDNATWGLVQAVAIDTGLFALALGITQRRRLNRPSRWLWAGVVLFTGISVYANLAYGLAFTLDSLPVWVTSSKPYVLAGALPLLVLYLAEIVGSDLSYAVKVAEQAVKEAQKDAQKEARKAARTANGTEGFPMDLDAARAVRTANKAQAIDRLLTFYETNPNASYSEAGRHIGRSKTTVGSYLSELETTGRVERNGNGVQVLEG